jgi:hypothetical protein
VLANLLREENTKLTAMAPARIDEAWYLWCAPPLLLRSFPRRTHVPKKPTGVISLYTNPYSVSLFKPSLFKPSLKSLNRLVAGFV